MELEISGPFNLLSNEDLEIMDDVVQSFCESIDVILKTNFKSQKRDSTQLGSVSRNPSSKTEGITKNQKLAAIFCRQWLAGVLSELTTKLVDDASDRFNYESASKLMSPHLLEEGADVTSPDDIGVCVENARICGNGQIEVNYEIDPSAVPPHLKPKLKTQELAQLILQGKQTEQDLVQKLERFWSEMPTLLCQHLSQDENGEEADGAKAFKTIDDDLTGASQQKNEDNIATSSREDFSFAQGAQKTPLDDHAIEILENVARGSAPMDEEPLSVDVQQKLQHLEEKARELGVQGMDTYITLYNKVNKEITNINRMAKFFSKLANDVSPLNDQIEIM
ncbi:hypothetical protein X943_001552 [Babesia divergens]|uniref:Uncharacterized protein n=1 Tax=Babesia divergens TaxID=32595 RepID=A0AAD9GHB9_BABDI|nr:hypothetical protein X943_001552 [Babesia divergens]